MCVFLECRDVDEEDAERGRILDLGNRRHTSETQDGKNATLVPEFPSSAVTLDGFGCGEVLERDAEGFGRVTELV